MKYTDWIVLSPLFIKSLGKFPARHLIYLAKQFNNEMPHRHNGKMYINTFFPPYPSKAFDRFVDSVSNRKRIPYSTYFAVADKCPYNCPHCSYGLHKKGCMDTKQAILTIQQIKSLGTITIGFTGGEPLLRDDIAELIGSVGNETETILFTTGHRLTKELSHKLSSHCLGCIMIGLESNIATEHNKIRGADGSFDEAIKAVELSLEAGIYTAISTVGTREKINDGTIEQIAESAAKLGVHELRVLEPIATGSIYSSKNEFLGPAETKKLIEFHKNWNRRNHGPAVCCFSYMESDEMFGCGAGYHHLFIDAIGNVCPCDLTPLSFGNMLEEPLEKIWLRMGEIFDMPRCGCLMKEICKNMNISDGQLLPLDTQTSFNLCKSAAKGKGLPMVYRNLFKHQ